LASILQKRVLTGALLQFTKGSIDMISVEQVSLSFSSREILKSVSFSLAEGEKVGLVGENGAGKTTLLRLLAGELMPDSGNVRTDNHRITYVPQHLSIASLKDITVLSFVLEGRGLDRINKRMREIENSFNESVSDVEMEKLTAEYSTLETKFNELEGYRAESDVRALAMGLGLKNNDLDRRVAVLSGGQKRRLLLVRMLYEVSDMLLLDEPTNHIDEIASNWLAGYLRNVQKIVVVISHSQDFLDKTIEKILYLDKTTGSLRSFPGNYSKFSNLIQSERLLLERTAQKTQAEIQRQEAIIKATPQSKSKQKHSREKTLARLKSGITIVQRTRNISAKFHTTTKLYGYALSLQGIAKSFGPKKVLGGISVDLESNDRLGITGENGAGKTTLLRVIAGDLEPDQGTVRINTKAEMGWYQQEQEDLIDANTVIEEVKTLGINSTQILRSAFAHFLFNEEQIGQKVGTLSRGERARLALCKIMLKRPNLLLLDEPTNHLDRLSRESLIGALVDYDGTIMVVSHDLDFLKRIGVEWHIELPNGKLARV